MDVVDVTEDLGEDGEEIIVALTRDSDPAVKTKAAFALASIKDETCLAFLQERFFRYGHAEVQTVNALLELVQ